MACSINADELPPWQDEWSFSVSRSRSRSLQLLHITLSTVRKLWRYSDQTARCQQQQYATQPWRIWLVGDYPDMFCKANKVAVSEEPLYPGGLSFHRIILTVVCVCAGISIILTGWLMFDHALHYSHPLRQKQILRILLIVPVYAITAVLVTTFHYYYVYFTIVSALYEPLCIVSYLTLLLYLGFDSTKQLDAWLDSQSGAKPWLFPMNVLYPITGRQKGPFRTPRTARTQFNVSRLPSLF